MNINVENVLETFDKMNSTLRDKLVEPIAKASLIENWKTYHLASSGEVHEATTNTSEGQEQVNLQIMMPKNPGSSRKTSTPVRVWE